MGCLTALDPSVVNVAQTKHRWVRGWKGVQGISMGCGDACVAGGTRVGTAPAFAGLGQYGVQIDQMLKPLRPAGGHGGAQHAGVGVHHQHHIVHFFGIHGGHHVLNVRFQIDVGAQQVGTFAHASQRDGVSPVTCLDEAWQNTLPAPGAMPGPVNQ